MTLTESPVQPAVYLSNIRVQFGGRTVLELDELHLAEGRHLGIIGPNGAGKSTLLRVVGLQQQPDCGQVRLLGCHVWPPRPDLTLRRKIAVVFQKPLLLDMSVFNNVALGLRIRGLADEVVRDTTELWLRQFGVWDLRSRGIHGLSGGEAQRVSLARAFALKPQLMLMDEPFSGLDLPTRQQLLNDVSRALGDTQTTSLLVSHDFYEVARLCDDSMVLFGGHVVDKAPPGDLLNGGRHPVVEEILAPWKELSNWTQRHGPTG